jgi:hypothetical protein
LKILSTPRKEELGFCCDFCYFNGQFHQKKTMPARSVYFKSILLVCGAAVLYFEIDRAILRVGWPVTGITAILLIIIASLYFFVVPFLKRLYAQLILLVICLAAAILMPYGYLYGLIDFKRHRESHERVVHDFNRGGFDSLLTSDAYRSNGVRLSARPDQVIDIYADSNLRMVFFFKHIDGRSFCGDLFISKPGLITDNRVYYFLRRHFAYTKLNDNWYWIETAP